MKKKLVLLLVLLLCLPLCAKGELKYEILENKKLLESRNEVLFSDLDGWIGYFRFADDWTFVTADNLDKHLDLVLARGDTEEAVRARFAQETLVFEAYSPLLPVDTCFRVERYENDFTRKVWDMMQQQQGDWKAIRDELLERRILKNYDISNLMIEGHNSYYAGVIRGWYTNYVPDLHEGGSINIRFHNGVMYVMTQSICGRLSGADKYWTEADNAYRFSAGDFSQESRPRPANLELNDLWPVHVNVENSAYLPATFTDLYPNMEDTCKSVTYTGTIEWGSKLSVTLDGEDVPVEMKDKYNFSVTLPMKTAGDHQAVFTLSHTKYQDHVRTVTIRATEEYVPLVFTSLPETYILTGDHTVAGITAPCATVTLRLDDSDPVEVVVDEKGKFTHTLTIEDNQIHTLRVEAAIPGRQTTCYEKEFLAEFADAYAAIRHFEQGGISEVRMESIMKDPNAYIGERIRTKAWTREVNLVNGEGLSVRCIWNYEGLAGNYWWQRTDDAPQYIYLKVPSYMQDGLYKDMMLEVYGTVSGTHPYTSPEGVTTDVLEVEVEFVTYYE